MYTLIACWCNTTTLRYNNIHSVSSHVLVSVWTHESLLGLRLLRYVTPWDLCYLLGNISTVVSRIE